MDSNTSSNAPSAGNSVESGTKLSNRLKSKHGIVGWRAWYTGGRVYDSASCSWEDLPELGVLVILLYCRERHRSRRLSGRSLYWREPTEDGFIYGHDDAADAILPEGAERKGWLKRGEYVTEE